MPPDSTVDFKILLVDDEDQQRLLLRAFFETHGCRVVEASDGGEALAVAEKEGPQVIIMDLDMPNLGGGPTVHVLTELVATANIPIIIYSGHDERHVAQSVTLGPRLRFMKKPGDLKLMWAWVSEMRPKG